MMNRTFSALATAAGVAVVIVSGAVLAADQPPPAAPVFTAGQAIAGKTAFAKVCAPCHMPDLSGNNEAPPLAGMIFMDTWGGRTTKELFDYMSAEMPRGGTPQTVETYLALTAFVLQSNGAAAGDDPFTATTAVQIERVAHADKQR